MTTLVAALAATVCMFYARSTASSAPKIVAPSFVILALLSFCRNAYRVGRRISFTQREKKHQADPPFDLKIPDDVKRVQEYNGAETLHAAQRDFINKAVAAQGRYFGDGILISSLPPVALFLLSAQLLTFPQGGYWAMGLIIAELFCLVALVYLALTKRSQTAEWMGNRLRAELLRREQYLLLARVGAYATMTDSEVAGEASRRRGRLEGVEEDVLRGYIPSDDFSDVRSLLDSYSGRTSITASVEDCLERIRTYLYYRVGKQLLWFSNEIRDCEENEKRWNAVLAASLIGAIVAAVAHLISLSSNVTRAAVKQSEGVAGIVVGALAIVLPPVATAIVSMKNIYNFRGRKRIYRHELNQLSTSKGALEALLLKIDHTGSTTQERESLERVAAEINLEFRTLVVFTEGSLASEMEKWILLMERDEAEISA